MLISDCFASIEKRARRATIFMAAAPAARLTAPRDHGNARSAPECGSAPAGLESKPESGSWRYRTPRCLRHYHFQSSVGMFALQRAEAGAPFDRQSETMVQRSLTGDDVMRRNAVPLLLLSLLWLPAVAAQGQTITPSQVRTLTERIPPRPAQALTGSQFAEYVSKMDPQQREHAILSEILQGNVPSFLRKLIPVELKQRANGRSLAATIFVMPDYLAIGSDKDYLRIPMNFYTAAAILAHFGFVLPTRKIVDAIYDQSSYHFRPQPLPPGPEMRSTRYYRIHNEMIERQSRARGIPTGALVSGDKKDVVITNRLARRPDRLALYGWHRRTGAPIQPLSTRHGALYADYSHGIRLVSEVAILNGQLRSIYAILQDSSLAKVLSDEGPIRGLRPLAAPPRSLFTGLPNFLPTPASGSGQ